MFATQQIYERVLTAQHCSALPASLVFSAAAVVSVGRVTQTGSGMDPLQSALTVSSVVAAR